MAFLRIGCTKPLNGSVEVQGSKNAALPILAASLLCRGVVTLEHVPRISDVETMLELLGICGCKVEWKQNTVCIDASGPLQSSLLEAAAGKMRCSVNLLAPLLVRCHKAALVKPGGCVLGKRPIDLHIMALEKMGVLFSQQSECILAELPKEHSLTGAEITFRFPSVGATQQAITAAVAAEGITELKQCAKEPEVVELCCFLKKMGAAISGIGTSHLIIEGGRCLSSVTYRIGADRIAAATYLSAAAGCGGEVYLAGVKPWYMDGIIQPFEAIGCRCSFDAGGMYAERKKELIAIPYIETGPYPGFPTDVQSLLLAVLTKANGKSVIKETIFESRFRTAFQLQKMGAEIIIKDNCAVVYGSCLKAANVEAPDLRGGAALVIAGLMAEGTTCIYGYEYIQRGYENLIRDLTCLGASDIFGI